VVVLMLIGVVVLVSSQPRVLCDPVAPENGFGFKMGGKAHRAQPT